MRAYLMVSQLVTWLLTLLLTLFLPRFLGAAAVGQLHFANSLWAIVVVLVSFGMDQLITKEVARAPEKTAELFGTSVVVRAILYVFGFGAVALYLHLLDYPTLTVQVVYVIGISQLAGLFIGAVQASLQGLEKMQYMSIGTVAGKAVNTVVCIILLLLGYGVLVIAMITVLSAFVNLGIQLFYLRRLQPVRLRFSWSASVGMLRAGSPYLFTYLFLVIYQQVDAIIIAGLVNETTLGWYSAADRLFGTFLFVPTVFMTAVFPALSRLYVTEGEGDQLSRIMSKSFDLLLMLSVPIGLGVIVVARPLVILLFGAEFANSGPILAVMGVVLTLTYQNMLLGQFVISTDRQNKWTVIMAIAAISTVPLDLVLVPWCQAQFGNGAIGGAIAFVITETGMMFAGLRLLPPGSLKRSNLWSGARIFAAGFVMMGAAWLLRDTFLLLPVAVGGLVYGLLLVLLRVIGPAEWQLLRRVWGNLSARLRRKGGDPAKPGAAP
jgi:O-antigen/teichoic acid export membrane protein